MKEMKMQLNYLTVRNITSLVLITLAALSNLASAATKRTVSCIVVTKSHPFPKTFSSSIFMLPQTKLVFHNPIDHGAVISTTLEDRSEDFPLTVPVLNIGGFATAQPGQTPFQIEFPTSVFPHGVRNVTMELRPGRMTLVAYDKSGNTVVQQAVPAGNPQYKVSSHVTLQARHVQRIDFFGFETLMYNVCWVKEAD